MVRQLFLLLSVIVLFAGCSSPKLRAELTVEEENRFVQDKSFCDKKAAESARGFGQESITWERKRREIYDYCMANKGWDKDSLLELE
ncbi:hypothetical protein MNBD_NITROSPINAE05-755 [hydrothermal vent metagenome]|uniref:Lipoprotein n=1 Tax=hydrothermal vent metagenome TaxID=652676 RepID=A0A3B1CHU7_9ZZZZ